MSENFSIVNTTKGTFQNVPFLRIKETVLGKDYNLSLVFIGEKTSRHLNKTYRGKDTPTNILSFPLDKKTGEIFITPTVAKKEGFAVGFLFIHGLLHLNGLAHGDTMEKAEMKLRKQFRV